MASPSESDAALRRLPLRLPAAQATGSHMQSSSPSCYGPRMLHIFGGVIGVALLSESEAALCSLASTAVPAKLQ